MSDGLITKKIDEETDDEVLSMPRFKDFYRQWLKERDAMLSSEEVVKIPGEEGHCDWYIIPLPNLKRKPKADK